MIRQRRLKVCRSWPRRLLPKLPPSTIPRRPVRRKTRLRRIPPVHRPRIRKRSRPPVRPRKLLRKIEIDAFLVYDGAGGDDIPDVPPQNGSQINGTCPAPPFQFSQVETVAPARAQFNQQGIADGANHKMQPSRQRRQTSLYFYINVTREPSKRSPAASSAQSSRAVTVDWNADGFPMPPRRRSLIPGTTRNPLRKRLVREAASSQASSWRLLREPAKRRLDAADCNILIIWVCWRGLCCCDILLPRVF